MPGAITYEEHLSHYEKEPNVKNIVFGPRQLLYADRKFRDTRHPHHPRSGSINLRHPRQPRHIFDQRQNYVNPHQNLTHATYEPTLPTPPTLFNMLWSKDYPQSYLRVHLHIRDQGTRQR